MVLQSLLDKIQGRFNVSAAQLDQHDLWQRGTLGIAVISNGRATAERVLNQVRDCVEQDPRCDVCECRVEVL